MGVKGVNFINKQRAKVMKGLLQSSLYTFGYFVTCYLLFFSVTHLKEIAGL